MSQRAVRILTVCAVAAIAAAAAFMVWHRFTATPAPALTVATGLPSHVPIPARPAPATRPTPVTAPGACGTAMAQVRSLMGAHPSGATLDEAANDALTTDLARLDQACASAPALDQAFRDTELTPWLTYLPKDGA